MNFEFKKGNVVFIDDQGNEMGLFKHQAKRLLEELRKSLRDWDLSLAKFITVDDLLGERHITFKNRKDSGKTFCGVEYIPLDVTFEPLLYGGSTDGLCKDCKKMYWERM